MNIFAKFALRMQDILKNIDSPADLRKLGEKELPQLCEEVRSYMVDICSRNPGHLASSLGAVELIVGVHYVFNTPEDKLVFDVGHQAYAHKILTGRREAFATMRTAGGPSGFPRMDESEYDAFGVGHSSTSISATLGYAEAARLQGRDTESIAIIGDGALTGGMSFEALNNAGASESNILIILNDNDASIDRGTGGLHEHLLRITTSARYNIIKNRVWNALGKKKGLRNFLQRWIRSLKSWFVKKNGGDLFEALGLRYFGPIDGNDIDQVVKTLRKLKEIKGPRVLHCITTKGKGYAPAEADPTVWHAPGKFNPENGERIVNPHPADRYQDVFGEVLCELAAMDSRVVGITPAMASGCGMNRLAERMPERFFDVGIEEEHSVTFSAGLAAAGMRPFCNIYSSFSQRAYDQIIHDVALQKLPVILCFDRAGLVGEDGATHNGAFDLAAYRSIPDCIVSAPANETELKQLMYSALHHEHGPYIIRYPRGMGEGADWKNAPYEEIPLGKAVELKKGSKIAVIAEGPCVGAALKAAAGNPEVGVYNFRFLKPLDNGMLDMISKSYKAVITVEDGALAGGLYSAVCERLAPVPGSPAVHGLGIPDAFVPHDRQAAQRAACGIDAEGIAGKIKELQESF